MTEDVDKLVAAVERLEAVADRLEGAAQRGGKAPGPRMLAVLEALVGAGGVGLNAGDLKERCNLAEGRAYAILRGLERRGLAQRGGRWPTEWMATPDGQKYLNETKEMKA